MRVAGAIDDQNTFTLDGIDVTDNIVGGLGADIAVIPLGVDSVEEFRVGVNNPNASFGRASGGQIAVVGKSGTNRFHGSSYWYHQNDYFNANEWELNRIHQARPVIRDNRFGGAVGGPLWKDKTFFFFNYEGRRFPQQSSFTRLMPSNLAAVGTEISRRRMMNVSTAPLSPPPAAWPAGRARPGPRHRARSARAP